ncbi:protoporphyrinogen oxidase HemJ [Thiohalobacter sp. IOR34]|uniref:protoporphyrinogen oxidase HemJ n=1 Tax=Thiohalobacter sp. IOR34 TaxID=3057176 RepID=UPI00339DA2B1
MPWVLAFHVIAMVTWFAGLFYLPRLFVYHAMSEDTPSRERFKIMERKLYYGIMAPAALTTIGLGLWLLAANWPAYAQAGWMHAKLTLVGALILYHLQCGRWLAAFRNDRNKRSHRYFRWMNELPVLALVGIIILVIVKPF